MTKHLQVILELQALTIESTSGDIAILNPEGKCFYMNDAQVKQFGYESADELMGKSWEIFYKPVEINRFAKLIFPTVEVEVEGTWRGETLGLKKNGEAIYQEITLSRLDDGGLICVTRVLDDLKHLERQLQIRNQQVSSIIKNVNAGILLEDNQGFYCG